MKMVIFIILLALVCSCNTYHPNKERERIDIFHEDEVDFKKKIATTPLDSNHDTIFLKLRFGMTEQEYCKHLTKIIPDIPLFNKGIVFRDDTITGEKQPILSANDFIAYQFFPESDPNQTSSLNKILDEPIAVQLKPSFIKNHLIKLDLITISTPKDVIMYKSMGISGVSGYSIEEYGTLAYIDKLNSLYEKRYGESNNRITVKSAFDTTVDTWYEPYWILGNLLIEISSGNKQAIISYTDLKAVNMLDSLKKEKNIKIELKQRENIYGPTQNSGTRYD